MRGCPDHDTFWTVVTGSASPIDRDRLLDHAADCSLCRQHLEVLALVARPEKSAWRWWLPAAAAAVFLIVALSIVLKPGAGPEPTVDNSRPAPGEHPRVSEKGPERLAPAPDEETLPEHVVERPKPGPEKEEPPGPGPEKTPVGKEKPAPEVVREDPGPEEKPPKDDVVENPPGKETPEPEQKPPDREKPPREKDPVVKKDPGPEKPPEEEKEKDPAAIAKVDAAIEGFRKYWGQARGNRPRDVQIKSDAITRLFIHRDDRILSIFLDKFQKERSPKVREICLRGIAQYPRSEEAAEVIFREVRRLGRNGRGEAKGMICRLLETGASMDPEISRPYVEYPLEFLQDKDGELVASAVACLGAMKHPRPVASLIRLEDSLQAPMRARMRNWKRPRDAPAYVKCDGD